MGGFGAIRWVGRKRFLGEGGIPRNSIHRINTYIRYSKMGATHAEHKIADFGKLQINYAIDRFP